MPSRRQFLSGSALAFGAAALPAVPAAADVPHGEGAGPGRRRPNVVVILADDLGYGELGAYGQRTIQTPNIDRLAAEGLRFTDAYSSGPVCAPSRCSLLTGLHSGHARVRINPSGDPNSVALRDGDTTFAEVLRARGYRTAIIGKWGFGPEQAGQASHPNARGFEEFYGYMTHGNAHNYYPADLWHNGEKEPVPENAGGKKGAFAPDLFRDRAIDFIKAHRDEPFLLFLTPNVPHAPSDVPSTAPYDGASWPAADKGHAAQVTRLDGYVGSVVSALQDHGLAGSTIVLVTSDNGPHEEGSFNPDLFDANGPLRGYKRNLYEGGVRIPLIAWSPGRIRPGTSDRPTQQTDLLPTLAELAGAPAPRDIDGISIASLLDGGSGSAAAAGHLYWYRLDTGVTRRANEVESGRISRAAEAVRQDGWKAVRFAPGTDRTVPDDQWQVELYDLRSDIGETTDVAAAHPEVAARLVGLMRNSWVDDYEREPFGLRLEAPEILLPGITYTITATLANGSRQIWTGGRLRLRTPREWTVRPITRDGFGRLTPGLSARAEWQVTVPEKTSATTWPLELTVTCTAGGRPLSFRAERTFVPPPPPPAADAYLSDLTWLSAVNGWGPVEIDTSNGKAEAGDGTPISFGGTQYAKGLGVHSHSEVTYHLGGRCTRFSSIVGIDDFSARQNNRGNVIAEVWADETKIFDSGVLRAATGPQPVDVDVTGARLLRLVVRKATESNSFNHTSWANAFVRHANPDT
ncbi:sulfatase-like hydrolase/transferase [Actinomadura alba]|uniref:Sulfatase-like hydrolase/transferase n=1 Tax=Actinomadura alba TaxID=406431 RepID=A0ABR7LV34_9ACTN|nr:sulfatase-like hydrolase/transferase [Actinomadura alba]MBC6468639.1 sulfatase-like hydrolase/transferase [Actinomadura alba]